MAKSTYIFDAKEWIITGRQAVKKLRSGNTKKMIEIRLVGAPDDDDVSYNKWVSPEELFHVTGDGE